MKGMLSTVDSFAPEDIARVTSQPTTRNMCALWPAATKMHWLRLAALVFGWFSVRQCGAE
jgi:hypothetical protein